MFGYTLFFIVISLLPHTALTRRDGSPMGCDQNSKPVTQANCQTALAKIKYSADGITAGETNIKVFQGDCLIDITSTNLAASMKADIEGAVAEIATNCPQTFAGWNDKAIGFKVLVTQVAPDTAPFGSNYQVGIPTCGIQTAKPTQIVTQDCVAAITSMAENPAGSIIPLLQNPVQPGSLYQELGTCAIYFRSINRLDITLDKPALQAMLKQLTDACKQQSGMLLNPGGSFGLNSMIFLQITPA